MRSFTEIGNIFKVMVWVVGVFEGFLCFLFFHDLKNTFFFSFWQKLTFQVTLGGGGALVLFRFRIKQVVILNTAHNKYN